MLTPSQSGSPTSEPYADPSHALTPALRARAHEAVARFRIREGLFAEILAGTSVPSGADGRRMLRPGDRLERGELNDFLAGGWDPGDSCALWSVGPRAALDLAFETAPRRLVLELSAYFGPDGLQGAIFMAGGRRVGGVLFDAAREFRTVTVTLPHDIGRAFRLEIDIVAPTAPRDVGPSDDARPLGLSLWSLEVG